MLRFYFSHLDSAIDAAYRQGETSWSLTTECDEMKSCANQTYVHASRLEEQVSTSSISLRKFLGLYRLVERPTTLSCESPPSQP